MENLAGVSQTEEQGTTPAPESTHGDTPVTTTGIEDLRAAFADSPSKDSNTSAPDETTGDSKADAKADAKQDTPADGATGKDASGAPEAPSGPSDEDLAKVFQDPRVVQQLREAQGRAMAQARQLWEQEQAEARRKEEELLLDDEEIGKRVRAQQQAEPILNQARAEGYARAQQEFVLQGIGSIWNDVPELKEMDSAAKAKYDPMLPTWKTFGEYINAIVDVAANSRSQKLAEKKAKEIAKAMTAEQLNSFRKTQPNPAGVPGHGSAVGKIYDVDAMSGKDLFRAAFSD